MHVYFDGSDNLPESERVRIEEALRFMQYSPSEQNPDLSTVRDKHVRILKSSSSNVRLWNRGGKATRMYDPFSNFRHFDAMAFGHFHDPRNTLEGDIFDSGGYVDHIETSLDIRDNGTIERDVRRLPHPKPLLEAAQSKPKVVGRTAFAPMTTFVRRNPELVARLILAAPEMETTDFSSRGLRRVSARYQRRGSLKGR